MNWNWKSILLVVMMTLLGPGLQGADETSLKVSLELDRGKLLAEESQKAVVRVSIKAPQVITSSQRPPVNICLVLDTSGSMQGSKLAYAKEGALDAIRRLGLSDCFSVVEYNGTASTQIPSGSLAENANFASRIEMLNARGSTALFAGVSLGAAELRKALNTHAIHRLILLSDGQANVGPDQPEDLGRLGIALSKEGIAVATVGVGDDYNEDLMTRLSQSSEGNTYFVENSRDLPSIFQRELGDVLNVYAQEVLVQVDFPEWAKPVGLLGREGRIEAQSAKIPLKQIYGGQEKFVLIEVNVKGGKDGETLCLAQAKIDYALPGNNQSFSLASQLDVPFTVQKAEVLASSNSEVIRDRELMSNTMAVDKALYLEKEGKTEAAAIELRQSAERLKKVAKVNKDEMLEKKAEEMDAYAADLESNRLDTKKRKVLKTDNYQAQTQQSVFVVSDKKDEVESWDPLKVEFTKPKPDKEKDPEADKKEKTKKPKVKKEKDQ